VVQNPLILLFAAAAAAGTFVIGAAVVFLLIIDTGSFETGRCRALDGIVREIERSDAFARSFDRIWDELTIQAIAGASNFHVTLTESEVSARAAELLGDDFPVSEITICFHDGYAEAWAKGEIPTLGDLPLFGGLFDAVARARGTLDFSGPYARFTFSELNIENVPGFIEDEIRDEAEKEANETLATMPLDYEYNLTFTEGAVTVSVSP
jgi:hypothetical protein